MLELRRVTKRYGKTLALDAIDLATEPARTTALMGGSGCGKSTLLRVAMGLIAPDAGSVQFDGVPVLPATAPALRHRMGYVIQEGGLFPHLTGEANVALAARYRRWDERRVEERLSELAALVQLPRDVLVRYPAELSGGQRQRVGLMRALMLDPELLLLDEPLAALDPIVRSELQDDLRRIFEALRKTVVLVTHDVGEAAFLGHTVVLLRDGRIVQRGTMADLVTSPADPFVTRFIRAQRSALPVAP